MLKSMAIAAMEVSGLAALLTPVYAGRGVIFTGHRVLRDDQPTLIPGNAVTETQLDRMLTCIRRSGWDIVPLEAVPGLLADRSKPRFACLTFDDGFADNLTVAAPVLRAARAPFAVFPVVDFIARTRVPEQELLEWLILRTDCIDLRIGDTERFEAQTRTPEEKRMAFDRAMAFVWRRSPGLGSALAAELARLGLGTGTFMDDTFLTWTQLRELAHLPGVSIGTHSLTHRPLASLAEAEALAELVTSRQVLEEKLGVPVSSTAYPYGSRKECGRREYDLARAAGYTVGLTTRAGNLYAEHVDALLSLPRVTISMVPHASSDRFIRTSLRGIRNAALNRLRRRAA